ncbi:MAG: hypothetical protein QNJ70_16250 [Xenococcaceae cyanobacterium MO_207.B15]|nr:hypothetical protein [Xenococcaceae cyanobacterium MO_207.B15]
MRENQITGEIVDAAYQIITRLGAGLLESVMAYELRKRGNFNTDLIKNGITRIVNNL